MGVIDGFIPRKNDEIFPVAKGDVQKIIEKVTNGEVVLFIDELTIDDADLIRHIVKRAFPKDNTSASRSFFITIIEETDCDDRLIFTRAKDNHESWEYCDFMDKNKTALDEFFEENGEIKSGAVKSDYQICNIRNLKSEELDPKEIESFLSKYSEVKQSL